MWDLRSTLHPDGADVVQAALLNVAALRGELQALSLEVLLLEHGHLRRQSDFYSLFLSFLSETHVQILKCDHLLHS